MNSKQAKPVYASAVASILAVSFVVITTILAELSPGLKDVLKGLTGHHWVSKSVFMMLLYLAVFALLYFSTKEISPEKLRSALTRLILVTIAGTLAIFIFYILHFLGVL